MAEGMNWISMTSDISVNSCNEQHAFSNSLCRDNLDIMSPSPPLLQLIDTTSTLITSTHYDVSPRANCTPYFQTLTSGPALSSPKLHKTAPDPSSKTDFYDTPFHIRDSLQGASPKIPPCSLRSIIHPYPLPLPQTENMPTSSE